ncbi:hypothetical protein PHJA_001677600 [Phtheirospermum japonicum]|uniref:Clp R domain-containing protein n=1 Tax=Phtheirospermum japonicum TaxID=374723 RepID=A0A830CHE7_9LAMI|nr:hypothetical protein PHJA_001677600 [Phtheirospermum japonicum]
MKTGGYAVHQALKPDAAGIVTQAVALAKQRGHSQVTPLHVANAMLAAPNGILRAARSRAHSHPLQCKALELCFNVALNRLPLESTVKELMDRVERQDVPVELREVKFITISPLYSFSNLERHFVEQKMGELSCLVKSLVPKGVVLYLGDLNWISDYRVLDQGRGYYCSVEHVKMEIGKLVRGMVNGRFWVMGIANFQTYIKCRNGNYYSLEDVWGLHAVTIPANNLGFSLISQSDEGRDENESGQPKSSTLPPWLKDESRKLCINNDQNYIAKKWNSSAHEQPRFLEKTLTLSSSALSPSSSTCFSFDPQNPNDPQRKAFSSDPSSTPGSLFLSESMDTGYVQRFKEFNAQNLNFICNALETEVPWQKEIIPEIAGTILQCRSGMLGRKDKITCNNDVKGETWLFFLGPDAQAKEKIARHLAKTVFCSCSNFVSIEIISTNFTSPTKSDSSSEDYRNKRGRDEQSQSSYIDRFAHAVSENPHRVFLLEDLEQADYFSQTGIKRAIEKGKILSNVSGEEVSVYDAIFILSCERFRLRSRACSPSKEIDEIKSDSVPLDLNISVDVDDGAVDWSVDDLGILESVDRLVVFNMQKL